MENPPPRKELLRESHARGVHGRIHEIVGDNIDVRRRGRHESRRIAALVRIRIRHVAREVDRRLPQGAHLSTRHNVRNVRVHETVPHPNRRFSVVRDVPRQTQAGPEVVLVAA